MPLRSEIVTEGGALAEPALEEVEVEILIHDVPVDQLPSVAPRRGGRWGRGWGARRAGGRGRPRGCCGPGRRCRGTWQNA